jgi:hypothetical protein
MRQEALDLLRPELPGRAAAVKGGVAAHPLQVGLLGTQRQVARAHALAGRGQDFQQRRFGDDRLA